MGILNIYYHALSKKRNYTPSIYKVYFVYNSTIIWLAPKTGFSIKKDFVISCTIEIKKPEGKKGTVNIEKTILGTKKVLGIEETIGV